MLPNRNTSPTLPSQQSKESKNYKESVWELTVHVMFVCKDIQMFVIICTKQLDNQPRKHLAVYDLPSTQDMKLHTNSRFHFVIKHSMMPIALLAMLINKTLLLFQCHSSLNKTSLFIYPWERYSQVLAGLSLLFALFM